MVILVSFLLILASAGLLTAGFLLATDLLVWVSLAISILAGVVLYVGLRRQRAMRRPHMSASTANSQSVAPLGTDETTKPGQTVAAHSSGGLPVAAASMPSAATVPVSQWVNEATQPLPKMQNDYVDMERTARLDASHPISVASMAARVTPVQSKEMPPLVVVAESESVADPKPPEVLPEPVVVPQQPAVAEVVPTPELLETQPESPAPLAADVSSSATSAETVMQTSTLSPPPDEAVLDSQASAATTSDDEQPDSTGGVDSDLVEDYEDPPDEPPAELLLPTENGRLGKMSGDVVVVDGRPRFHLRECEFVTGKDSQSLSIAEAVELGFTSCSQCAAATTFLAELDL